VLLTWLNTQNKNLQRFFILQIDKRRADIYPSRFLRTAMLTFLVSNFVLGGGYFGLMESRIREDSS
jgi:hypothetical protein